jgi:phospholipase/carboxylesterase
MKSLLLQIILLITYSGLTSENVMEKLNGNEIELKYLERLPKIKSGKPPVIFLLHGIGSNEEDLFGLANEFPAEYLVISIRAPFTLGIGSYAWFHVQFLQDKRISNLQEEEKSRILLSQFIPKIIEKYNADADRVYLFGFSQGAIMSYSLALTSPLKIKGLVAIGGRILEEIKPKFKDKEQLKGLQIFVGHGEYDQVMPMAYANAAYTTLTSVGINVQFKKYPIEHTISPEEMKDVITWLGK